MRRLILSALFYLGVILLLSGCQYTLFNPQGLIAAQEMRLLITATLLMLIVVIPVIVMAVLFSWRYRAGSTSATYTPNWSHSTLIEIICWSIPCFIIILLGWLTWTSSHELDPYRPIPSANKPLVIQVIAYEWKWLFLYPEQKIATVNYVQFPVDVPVEFLITANGPMNSLLIPQLGGQIYAMAGMKTQLHLMANAVGDYQGISANFSGEGFSDMKFTASVRTQRQFNEWVQTVKKSPEKLFGTTYQRFIQPSEKNPVQVFSSFHPDIFETVLMKAMMPMKAIS